MDRTVSAFLRAFTVDDRVALVVKTGRLDYTRTRRRLKDGLRRRPGRAREAVAALRAQHPRPAPVYVVDDELLPDGEMRALHEVGDVFVSLTRSEGFGLGAFEAAARGKPVVMTRYGGQLDFLPPTRSWLVDYRMTPLRDPSRWAVFAHGTTWPEASIEDAVTVLRQIAADPDAARARAAPLADEIAERFSTRAVVAAFRAAVA